MRTKALLHDAIPATVVAGATALAVVLALRLGEGVALIAALGLGVLTPIAVAREGLRPTASRIGIGASGGVVPAMVLQPNGRD